ncbi:MAG: hypothetical protein KDE28_27110, partial [Anaerolineales bacterium]|nr:hypothetical protein [Anaerolineales bacterium]
MPITPHLKHAAKLILPLVLSLILISCGPEAEPTATAQAAETSSTVEGLAFIGTGSLPAGFDAQGHRGARGLLPENTLPAFEAALDLGATTLELDMHFTADGEVVIWHDPIIDKSKCRLP